MVTATRPKLPFVQQENDHYVPATSVVASVEAAGNQELQVSLGAEEAARRELAKKRSLNFDSKPPLGSSDSFGDSHLVRRNSQSFDFSDMAYSVTDGQVSLFRKRRRLVGQIEDPLNPPEKVLRIVSHYLLSNSRLEKKSVE